MTDKILTLGPGEFFILPDPKQTLDRQLITLRSRSPALQTIVFTATRVKYIQDDRLLPGIKITRT